MCVGISGTGVCGLWDQPPKGDRGWGSGTEPGGGGDLAAAWGQEAWGVHGLESCPSATLTPCHMAPSSCRSLLGAHESSAFCHPFAPVGVTPWRFTTAGPPQH